MWCSHRAKAIEKRQVESIHCRGLGLGLGRVLWASGFRFELGRGSSLGSARAWTRAEPKPVLAPRPRARSPQPAAQPQAHSRPPSPKPKPVTIDDAFSLRPGPRRRPVLDPHRRSDRRLARSPMDSLIDARRVKTLQSLGIACGLTAG